MAERGNLCKDAPRRRAMFFRWGRQGHWVGVRGVGRGAWDCISDIVSVDSDTPDANRCGATLDKRPSGSDLRHASVNEELDAIDETGGIRGKKRHRFANFLRFAQAAQRHLCSQIIKRLLTGLVGHQPAQPWRADRTRADHIYTDATLFQVQRPRAREVAHRRLAGAIDAEIRCALYRHS